MRSIKFHAFAFSLAAALATALPGLAAGSAADSELPAGTVTESITEAAPETAAAEAAAATTQTDRKSRMEHKFEKAEKYYAECQNVSDGQFEEIRPFLKAFTDMEVMADMMSDPVKLTQLMAVVNDPQTMHVMMKCSTEPVMWDTWVSGLGDYEKMMRAMTRFMDPGMYMRWMMAPMNAQVWAPMSQFMDPNYYGKWLTAFTNPTFYQPMYAWMDPNWYTPRLQWMTDPQSFAPLLNAVNIASSTEPENNDDGTAESTN